MSYSWRNILAVLQNPLVRSQFIYGIWRKSWPLLSRIATLYRYTLIRNTRVVAVVGSFGKSTTTRAVAHALVARLHPGYQNNYWSFLARSVLSIRPCDRYAVIEAGIVRPGRMGMYARRIRPNITVVTSIGSEHISSLGTLEVTRKEKFEMVRALPKRGIAILNGDDPNVCWMAKQTGARVVTFGTDKANDVRASEIMLDWPSGTRFKLHAGGQTRGLRIGLLGLHMVYPILAAVAVALAEGLALDDVIPALEALGPTPGRLEPIHLDNGAIILRDDIKSALETIDTALEVFSKIPAQRKIIVMGEISEFPGNQRWLYRMSLWYL